MLKYAMMYNIMLNTEEQVDIIIQALTRMPAYTSVLAPMKSQ
jgi:hypothetical protein